MLRHECIGKICSRMDHMGLLGKLVKYFWSYLGEQAANQTYITNPLPASAKECADPSESEYAMLQAFFAPSSL